MNLAVMGIFVFDPRGFFGAIYLSIGHAIVSGALFFLIGILYDRFQTRDLSLFGGLVQVMPLFSTALFFFSFANAGFPWSLSFVGEFMVLMGIARQLSLVVFLVLIFTSVLLLYANIRLFMNICFGTMNNNLISNPVADLTHLELFACS
jgi:NADH-quinone oxidoreductase subunit M